MKATVVGIERFCTAMWKGLYCDGCDRPYLGRPWSWHGVAIRAEAAAEGWCILAGSDLCPECAARRSAVEVDDG